MLAAAASATSTGQYINPDDILSPLSSPAEMDSKASPLAMLAKTCSQIGADPIVGSGSVTSNKTGSSTIMKKRNSPDQLARQRHSPLAGSISDPKSCILDGGSTTDPNTRSPIQSKSRSRSSSTEIRVTDNMTVNSSTCNKKITSTSPLLKSVGVGGVNVPTPSTTAATAISAAPSSRPLPPSVSYPAHSTAGTGASSNTSAAALLNNPFLASFASSLQQTPESGSGLTGGGGCMSSNNAAAAAAAAAAASSVCRDPMCRDPLCPTALRNQQHMNSFTYSSLLASPYYKEAMMAFTLQQRMAALAAGVPPGSAAAGALPHVCNWVAGTEYCGRRFANAEELLVHVKTHTNLSTSDPRALSILNAASSAPPTSHQRFHPYARPSVGVGSTPPTAPPPPSVTAPMPPALAALASNPYASLYTSLFSRPPLL